MMKITRRSVYVLVTAAMLLCCATTPALADTLTFVATGPVVPGLSAANESPATGSPGVGTATVTWDTVTSMMTVDVTFSLLTGPNTAAHIHCCVASPGTAGVATVTPTFTGFPAGASGTYLHTFDMLDAASYNPAFITAHGNTVLTARNDLLAGLLSGQTYLNIHTQANSGGEIRGFLQQVSVPEPGTYLLLGTGLLALILAQRSGKLAGRAL